MSREKTTLRTNFDLIPAAALLAWGAMALAVPMLGGCDGKEASQVMNGISKLTETKAPYPVKTSRLVFGTSIGSIEQVYWLDNDRALLPAYLVEQHQGPDGQGKSQASELGIYIWDVKRNTYTRYADLVNAPRLFHYHHGNIAYMVEWTDPMRGVFTAMVGKMGAEKRMVLDGSKGGILPELEPSMGPGLRYRHDGGVSTMIYALRPEDGYLYVGSGDPLSPGDPEGHVKLFRPGQSQPIELPILVKEMYSGAKFSYSDYARKYVLIPAVPRTQTDMHVSHPWPANEPVPIYFISPDGQVESQEIPPGFWHPDSAVFPTREGLFWVSNDTRGHPGGGILQNRNAGGWLLRDGKVIKLFDHLVDGAGVSPNGCTIVYANNDSNQATTEYVQAIDLCATRK
jgi:hypothetical protein